MKTQAVKKIGICAHSYEGGALCFITTCREGAEQLGPHMHPPVILSAVPMGLSMPGWESADHDAVAGFLREGVNQVARGGADFFICPDNTAHIVLEKIIDTLPIPGLHIARVVAGEISRNGWQRVGLLGTSWTMKGPVYEKALSEHHTDIILPGEPRMEQINRLIFEELCQGIFRPETIELFQDTITDLKEQGAQAVILGCTEIPLIIHPENSPLPVLDSTRLLAREAVKLSLSERDIPVKGWIR